MDTNLTREARSELDPVELPVEILEYILQLATAVPDPLVHPNRVRCADGGYEFPDGATGRYREAMAVKRTVVQVSHQWRAMAIGALYEHVVLSTLKALEAMVRVVGEPPAALIGYERTAGSYVKRVDLLVDHLYWVDGDSSVDDETESAAVRLCRALPNLVSLTFKSCDDDPYALKYLPFSEIVSTQLEYFDSRSTFPIPVIEMVNFLATHQRLVSCDFPYTDPSKYANSHIERLCSNGVTFSALQELVVHHTTSRGLDFLERVPADMVPNLTRLVIVYHEQPDDMAVRSLLSKYGRNLTSFDIRIDSQCPENHLAAWFSLVQEHCPKLHEFCLATDDIKTFPRYTGPPLPAYPSITVFGVQHIVSEPGVELNASKGWSGWKDFWYDVQQRALCFPNLRTIRLMDERNLDCLTSDACISQFTEGIKGWREKGVDVVDFLGRCLN